MSLILPIIRKEWNLSDFSIEVLSSVFYLGMMIGAMVTGKIADRRGRKPAILFSSVVQFIVGLSFAVVNSLSLLIFLRFIYGFVFGFSLPLTVSMVSEIFPLIYRGKSIIFVNFNTCIGRIYGLILATIIFTDYYTGNWRLLMVLCSLTSIIVIIGSFVYIKESPRFLISIEKFDEAVDIINHIGRVNNIQNYKPLSLNEINGLKNYQKNRFKAKEQASVKALFSRKCFDTTIRIWIIWFSLLFFGFGFLIVFPFIFHDQQKGFGTIFIALAGEIPTVFLAFFLIDLRNLGRRNSLTLCCFFIALLNIFAYVLANSIIFSFVLSMARFFLQTGFSMLVPLTSELYSTNYRIIGYGYAIGVGRSSVVICPYILLSLLDWNIYSSFLIFAALGVLSTWASHTIKFETAGRYLDSFLIEDTEMKEFV